MTGLIEAILFDVGGTLRKTTPRNRAESHKILQELNSLVGIELSAEELFQLLSVRASAYKRWSEETLIELGEQALWTDWMLPDYPSELVAGLAVRLNQIWREALGVRTVFPETKEVALELFRRGYRLGLISNTTSSTEVPRITGELGISGCFEVTLLSCTVGKRKPDPALLLEATDQMGVRPERCVYVGDRPERDVAAARKAGFAQAILRRDPHSKTAIQQAADPALAADHIISHLTDLLGLFPARSAEARRKTLLTNPTWDASLSTMWAWKHFPSLVDFLEASQRLGFTRVELNHQVNSSTLAGIDLDRVRVSSIHEPCPADVSTRELKENGWWLSATDEGKRQHGVQSVVRSIELASRLGTGIVVVHAGFISADIRLEKRLRYLVEAGVSGGADFQAIQSEMIAERAAQGEGRIAAVKKSLIELLPHAQRLGVRLGIENRYHFDDIPSIDEMGDLLELAPPEQIGMIFDIGHAHTLDRLGFFPLEEWLDRYSNRIIGTHLHDVRGVTDHFAPGLGEVKFERIASYLPDEAIRIIEVQSWNTTEQLKQGMKILANLGLVRRYS